MFKINYNSNGKIKKYKTHLVNKSFSQKEGRDYNKTFSLVVSNVTVRV